MIKQFKILALVLCITACYSVRAYDFQVGGIYYTITNASPNTVGVDNASAMGNSYSGRVNIPSSVVYNGVSYSVTSITVFAFGSSSGLTAVSIPNSVTFIENQAFSYCTSLTSITIPDSVSSMGWGLFMGSTQLDTITVSSGNPVFDSRNGCNAIVETATNKLVAGCRSTIIPNTVTKIGVRAFAYCSSLTSITIPNSVTEFDVEAFSNCTGLTNITIPNHVTKIGQSAFNTCRGLTGITIPLSVKSIGRGAFANCTALTTVTIPDSVHYIGMDAFAGDTSITAVFFNADSCRSDATWNGMFPGCTNIRSITIGNNVTIIPNFAFNDCRGVTSINLPNSVRIIGNSAFNLCIGLSSLTMSNSVDSIGVCAFSGCSALPAITLPSTLVYIGAHAFEYCPNLVSLQIPNSVKYIGGYAFADCYGLRSLILPDSLTLLTTSVFKNCRALVSLTIPRTVVSIDEYAFNNCSGLSAITIPSSVSTIANQAFSGCTNLNLIRFKRQTPPAFANVYCFTQVPSNALIVVPCNSTSAYSSAMSVWFSNFSEEYAFEITVGTADSTKGTAAVTVVPSCTSNQAQVLATPVQGYQFSHWSDGNTANPRTLAVTQDTLLVAYFTSGQSIVETNTETVSIALNGNKIVINGFGKERVVITDILGRIVYNAVTCNNVGVDLQQRGVYLVKVGNRPASKIVFVGK